MPALARSRSVRIDLPGSGRSHRVEGPLSIERFVGAVLAVTERLGIERFALAAHSLGTIVALHLAVREPRAGSSGWLCSGRCSARPMSLVPPSAAAAKRPVPKAPRAWRRSPMR